MRQVSISSRARLDLREALDFISTENPTAAKALSIRIREAADLLARFPLLGRTQAAANTRFFQVNGTPYGLYYRIRGDDILILRVWHGARGWPGIS